MDLCKNQPKVCSFHIICVLLHLDKEPFLRPFGNKRAELERKQAGDSASGVLASLW